MSFSASLRELQTLSAQQWLDRASRTLPQALTVVLVVAIAWQLVQLTWLLLERRAPADAADDRHGAAAAPPRPARASTFRRSSMRTCSARRRPSSQPDAADAPPTQMNLVLSAVFAANDPDQGPRDHRRVAAAAKVYAVGADGAAGHEAAFRLPGSRHPRSRRQARSAGAAEASTAGVADHASRLPRRARAAINSRTTCGASPRRIRRAFAEIMRPQPVFANGVQRGYRVYPGRNRQQFAKLGLQPGDLVLSINGTPLDDPQRGMEIFNTMGSVRSRHGDRRAQRPVAGAHAQHRPDQLPDANAPPPGRSPRQLHADPDARRSRTSRNDSRDRRSDSKDRP